MAWFWIWFGLAGWAGESLWLDLHGSETLQVRGLEKVAVGNGAILKARALSSSEILITGRKKGSTTLRAWTASGEKVWRVHVVQTESLAPVVGVRLQFLEWQGRSGRRTGVGLPNRLEAELAAHWAGPVNGGWRFEGRMLSPRIWVEAMVAQGKAKVVAEPSLFVKIGEEAKFQAGGEFPVSTTQSSEGTLFNRVEWKSYGLSARVRPRTVDAVHLSTQVQLDISEPMGRGEGDRPPALHRRKLETHVLSEDGETVLLSILQKHREETSREGFAWLSDLPVLGILFESRSRHTQGNALLVSLTLNLSHGPDTFREEMERKWSDGNL